MNSTHPLVRIMGYPATLIHGDAAVLDRWFFLRRHLAAGPLRTLDAGSGSGAMALYAAKRGNHVVGISLSARDNRVAGERADILGLAGTEFVTGDLRQLDVLAGAWQPFDQVICFETIEHILDDRKVLRDLAAIMKPGSTLILTTPYKHYHPLPGDRLSETEDGGHVRWGYTHEELRALLSELGFDIRAEEYITGYFSQLALRFERVLVTHGVPGKIAWALSFPLRILQALDPLAARIKKYPALSIGIVAVKQ